MDFWKYPHVVVVCVVVLASHLSPLWLAADRIPFGLVESPSWYIVYGICPRFVSFGYGDVQTNSTPHSFLLSSCSDIFVAMLFTKSLIWLGLAVSTAVAVPVEDLNSFSGQQRESGDAFKSLAQSAYDKAISQASKSLQSRTAGACTPSKIKVRREWYVATTGAGGLLGSRDVYPDLLQILIRKFISTAP